MKEDRIIITPLADGTAKMEVEGISGANHASAEKLVKEFARLMGGPVEVKKDPHGRKHQHRGHEHGQKHSH